MNQRAMRPGIWSKRANAKGMKRYEQVPSPSTVPDAKVQWKGSERTRWNLGERTHHDMSSQDDVITFTGPKGDRKGEGKGALAATSVPLPARVSGSMNLTSQTSRA